MCRNLTLCITFHSLALKIRKYSCSVYCFGLSLRVFSWYQWKTSKEFYLIAGSLSCITEEEILELNFLLVSVTCCHSFYFAVDCVTFNICRILCNFILVLFWVIADWKILWAGVKGSPLLWVLKKRPKKSPKQKQSFLQFVWRFLLSAITPKLTLSSKSSPVSVYHPLEFIQLYLEHKTYVMWVHLLFHASWVII